MISANFSFKRSFVLLATFCLLIAITDNLNAQGQLWGITAFGGSHGVGVAYKTNSDGTGSVVRIEAKADASGANPEGVTLALAANNKLYGTAPNGGDKGRGVLFEYDPASGVFTNRHDFDNDEGAPVGSLTAAPNGKLYGLAYKKLFEFDPAIGVFKVKAILSGVAGLYGSLAISPDGKLYGATVSGGLNSGGVLFEYDIASESYVEKYNFANQSSAAFGLVYKDGGKIYGVTSKGGSGYGYFFEFDLSTSTCLGKFNFSSSLLPGPITVGSNGKIYGINSSTIDGSIYEFDPAMNRLSVKYNLYPDAVASMGKLQEGAPGEFFGTARFGGGASYAGLLFKYNVNTGEFTHLHDFEDEDGEQPRGGVTLYNGKLYGVTCNGGKVDAGVLFEYDNTSNIYSKKFDFTYIVDALGLLTPAPNGKLYSSVRYAGLNNDGAIFELDPVANTYTRKYNFTSSDSFYPGTRLAVGNDNKLYGVGDGGANKVGVIFSYDIDLNTVEKKVDLDQQLTGYNCINGMTLASNGKFYALMHDGGINNVGTLIEYDPLLNNCTKKFDFKTPNGIYPTWNLVAAENGKLYAYVESGGDVSSFSITPLLFEYDPATSVFTKKITFPTLMGAAGISPSTAGLTIAKNGKIYGPIPDTDSSKPTSIMEYTPGSSTFSRVHNFPLGSYPQGSFVPANDKVYGVTLLGGTNSSGVLFEYDPATGNYTERFNFSSQTGSGPLGYLAFLPMARQVQTIEFDTLVKRPIHSSAFTISASASSNLGVTYSSSNPAVASIDGNIVTITGVGTTIISAYQAGNIDYFEATAKRVLEITKQAQTITFDSLMTRPLHSPSFNLSAIASSNLGIEYSSSNKAVATIDDKTVTIVGTGTTTITAYQSGNNDYNEAAVRRILIVIDDMTEPPATSPVTPPTDGVTTGIHTVEVDNSFVYPNPTGNEITVSLLRFDRNSDVSVFVLSLEGQVLQRIQLRKESVSMDLGNLSAGYYIIRASQGNSLTEQRIYKKN